MLLKRFESLGRTMRVTPIRPRGPPPPIRVIAQIHRAFCLLKNHRAGNEVLDGGARKIGGIERALRERHVPGLSHEASELFVGDRVAIDPEAGNSYFMDGTFFDVEFF